METALHRRIACFQINLSLDNQLPKSAQKTGVFGTVTQAVFVLPAYLEVYGFKTNH